MAIFVGVSGTEISNLENNLHNEDYDKEASLEENCKLMRIVKNYGNEEEEDDEIEEDEDDHDDEAEEGDDKSF